MELITIKCRTQKESGKIKLRFRLREGRGVELYHRSDIDADISVLDKLTPEGTKKKGVTVTSQMKMLQTFFPEMENLDEIGKSQFRKLGREKKESVMKTFYDEPYFLRKEELIRFLKKSPTETSINKGCLLGTLRPRMQSQ